MSNHVHNISITLHFGINALSDKEASDLLNKTKESMLTNNMDAGIRKIISKRVSEAPMTITEIGRGDMDGGSIVVSHTITIEA